MATKIRIGGEEYAAIIDGDLANPKWSGRATKTVTVAMTYELAEQLFRDNTAWFVVFDGVDEKGQPVHEEYNCSDYCLAGDLTDHRNGTVSAVMGKMTDLEEVLEMLYGGGADA